MASTRFDSPLEIRRHDSYPIPRAGYVMFGYGEDNTSYRPYFKFSDGRIEKITTDELLNIMFTVDDEEYHFFPLNYNVTGGNNFFYFAFVQSDNVKPNFLLEDGEGRMSFDLKNVKKGLQTYAQTLTGQNIFLTIGLEDYLTVAGDSLVIKQVGYAASNVTVQYSNRDNVYSLVTFAGTYELEIHAIKQTGVDSYMVYINLNGNKFIFNTQAAIIIDSTAGTFTKYFTKMYKEEFINYQYI